MRKKDGDPSGDDLDEEYSDITIEDGDDDGDDEEDSAGERSGKGSSLLYRRKLLQHRLFRVFLVLILVGLLCYAGYLIYRWITNRYFHEYEVRESYELNMEGQYSYIRFGNNLVYYNGDGAAYLDDNGKVVWARSYEMINPMAERRGNYLAIADIKGNSLEIFDESGFQGHVDTPLPITRFTLAEQGTVATILEAKDSNYINLFQKDGKRLDIELKAKISADENGGEGYGYPLDLSLSPSGEGMMVSFVSVQSTGLREKVSFFNFAVAKAEQGNLVAGFEEFGDSLVADVAFMGNRAAAAIGDEQIVFFNLSTDKAVSEVKRIDFEENYFDYFYSESYLGVVYRDETKVEDPYTVKVYDRSGKMILEKKFSEGYEDIFFHNDELIFYNSSYLTDLYLKDGTTKFAGTVGGDFDFVTAGPANNRLNTIGYQNMKVLKLVP